VTLGTFAAKPKPCAQCRNLFVPSRPMQNVCGPRCALRKVREEKVEERAKVRTRKEAVKTIPVLIKEAQFAFNAFIRERDKDQPCICCGKPLGVEGIGAPTGGAFDCGHYRSVGSASHLRFDERNAHGQRKVCNRYGAGRTVDYRIGLIGRIGLAAVEALEASNQPHKWQADELRAIRATYKDKLKQLQKEQA
jgi:hypothetical protein